MTAPSLSFTMKTNSGSSMNQADQYSYDLAGDLSADTQNSYLYDAEGQVCAEKPLAGGTGPTEGYIYDGESHRVAKGTLGTFARPSSANPLTLTNVYWLGPGGSVG